MNSKKVLLDTDIGTDIDDAVCLAYLLSQPDCDLQGITTVTGEAKKRAQLASTICKVAGQDIPIFPGAEKPIIVEQQQKIAQQAQNLNNWEYKESFPEGEAVEFMRKTIRAHPGEISLLTVGPLTNVGLLFRVDPKIPSLLKELVMMSGVFTGNVGAREWNAIGDPQATAIVFAQNVGLKRVVGLDVTTQVRMKAEQVRKEFTSELLEPVKDFAEIWFQERDELTFHDPLAAATLFDDEICSYKKGEIEVELLSERRKGATYLDLDENGSHQVALDVNRERFFDHFFSVF
ncbi:MAG: nucleoside hydrolase [Bacillota bacterium]